jgi:hypothetical protein
MNLEHDEGLEREHEAFADWDAAYVLGALAPVERLAYEDHLARCGRCREAVAELAPLPGLLARAPRPDTGEPGVSDEPALPDEPTWDDEPAAEAGARPAKAAGPDSAAANVVVRRRKTRHRLRRRLLMGVAAVVALGLAVAVPLLVLRGPQPAQTVALTAQTSTPLTASVSFTPTSWGTQLSMDCSYPTASDTTVPGYTSGSAAGVYSLVVTDVNGTATQVSTWSAQPGVDVTLNAATAVPLDQIASVAIHNASGTPVLTADLGAH